MDIEDPVETTTYIKKKAQQKMKQQILPPKKMKHKLQKVDIDQLQDQRQKRKKITNQLPPHTGN